MSSEKKPQPVARFNLTWLENIVGDSVRQMMPSTSGKFVRYSDHEATIEALRAEMDTAVKAWANADKLLAEELRRTETAEARVAQLEAALEPFAAIAEELENEPAWVGVLEHDHPLAGRVTVADFRRARALLSDGGRS